MNKGVLILGIIGIVCGLLVMLLAASSQRGGDFLFGLVIAVGAATAMMLSKVFNR